MTIKKFFESKDKLAIHCNTEEKAKKLLEAFDKAGHCWVTGDCYIEDTAWEIYEEETCYNNIGCYGSTNYFKECHHTILEFEEIELEDASLKSCIEKIDDLISRQAAIDAINSHFGFNIEEEYGSAVQEVINGLPSAQPRPRGRWVAVDSYSAFGGDMATWGAHGNPTAFWYCSFCREQNYVSEDGEPLLTDYCPHCGAKMEKE